MYSINGFNFKNEKLIIRRILGGHILGRKHNLDIIWSLLTFQIWYKTFIKI